MVDFPVIQGDDIRELPQPRLHGDLFFCLGVSVVLDVFCSKKSPTGPSERTPKPEYLVTLATYLGVRW